MQGHGSKKNNKFLFQWWINWITSKYQPGKHIYWQWTLLHFPSSQYLQVIFLTLLFLLVMCSISFDLDLVLKSHWLHTISLWCLSVWIFKCFSFSDENLHSLQSSWFCCFCHESPQITPHTGDASVWCESSDCVQCCIWHHKDCIDGEKVLTQNNINLYWDSQPQDLGRRSILLHRTTNTLSEVT